MTKILIIDDVQDNLDVLELLIEGYMEDNDIDDYSLTPMIDPVAALEKTNTEEYDIIFLDIMMPQMDGFEFLQSVRNNSTIKQPIIVMATALGDDLTKKKEQEYGANAYMVKPINSKVVSIMMDRYLEVLASQKFEVEDEFDFDFDFDDDFADEAKEDEDTEMDPSTAALRRIISNYNNIEPLDSSEFLGMYSWNSDGIERHLEDLDYLVFKVFDSLEENINNMDIDIENDFKNILEIIIEFGHFTASFSELKDIQFVLTHLEEILEHVDINYLSDQQKKRFTVLIKAIVSDLIDFKDKVFVEKSVPNIYYLNATIASSCLELDNLLSN